MAPGTGTRRTWSSRRPDPRSILARGRRNETGWLQTEGVRNSGIKSINVLYMEGSGEDENEDNSRVSTIPIELRKT